jgi:dTDP-4-dehydrorhamnose reductase
LLILITGAGGRIGRILERQLEARFPDRVVAATREEMDLTDPARLALEMERLDPPPTVAINCAALTDPGLAETSSEACLAVNRDGVATLARACRETGCRLIHLSTADVFDGRRKALYLESDPADASSPYGRVRALGEREAAEGNPDHLVLRLSLACGGGGAGDPLEEIARALEEGRSLPWDERRVSPVFPEDLGSAMATVLKSDWQGILHMADGGSCLLSDLVAETARILGSGAAPELAGGRGPASFWERGGPNAALDTGQFARLSGRRLREWQSALAATLGARGGT